MLISVLFNMCCITILKFYLQKSRFMLQGENAGWALTKYCVLFQVAVDFNYEGKTEAHASQKG